MSSSRWFAWYSKKLETHPLLTKGITSGLISGTADGLCQVISEPENPWDVLRTGRFFIMGAVWAAPITHVWYGALSTRLIPGPRSLSRITQRLVVDQFGFAPLFLPSFVGCLWILEGRDNIVQQLKEMIPDLIVANWSLWIPAMAVNFALVPLKYQVLFSNVVAFSWNVYLSWVNAASLKNMEQSARSLETEDIKK